MDAKAPVLKCGDVLTVRSQKAFSRLQDAGGLIGEGVDVVYSFTGINTDKLALYGEDYELVTDAEDDDCLKAVIKGQAVFFEQTHYNISIHLPEAEEAELFSPLATWCESSDWDDETKRLSIPINFGNDLGDFELCWEWKSIDGERHRASMSAQVFSYKLDIYSHFKWMLKDVTERFKWIQLDLLRQTTWGWSYDSDAEANQQTWLLIFQRVRNDMEDRLHRLIEEHRRRLVGEMRLLRPEQMRRLSPRLEEKVAEGLKDNPNRRYPVIKKVLDADTPENRYMKHILFQTHAELNAVMDRIENVERISDVFKERLAEWSEDWSRLKQQHFWKGIGDFQGLRKESLILSQDPLYAGIRRSWYWLKQGLAFLDQDLKGGIQNAAQLYEIWCLVKIDQLLEKEGWLCQSKDELNFDQSYDDFESEEIRSGAIKFVYQKESIKNVRLDVLFQPSASSKPDSQGIWDGMAATPVVQKPDIVLRLHRDDLPNQPVYTWIFDAKYRLHKHDKNLAPDDAINQMHRYRDAILWSDQTKGKSNNYMREGIGAYVLYPGALDTSELRQIKSIDLTNIGAFPLMPSESEKVPKQLSEKLASFLHIRSDYQGVMEDQEKYFSGVPQVKKAESGTVAVCAIRSKMNDDYWRTCRLYRLPLKQADKHKISPEAWQYIAPQSKGKKHCGLFPILSSELMTGNQVSGRYKEKHPELDDKASKEGEKYWLFELGEPIEAPDDLANLTKGHVVDVTHLPE